MPSYCIKCRREGGSISYHRFPDKEKYPEIHKKWLDFVKRDEVKKTTSLCRDHFYPEDIQGKKKLRKNAVPIEYNFVKCESYLSQSMDVDADSVVDLLPGSSDTSNSASETEYGSYLSLDTKDANSETVDAANVSQFFTPDGIILTSNGLTGVPLDNIIIEVVDTPSTSSNTFNSFNTSSDLNTPNDLNNKTSEPVNNTSNTSNLNGVNKQFRSRKRRIGGMLRKDFVSDEAWTRFQLNHKQILTKLKIAKRNVVRKNNAMQNLQKSIRDSKRQKFVEYVKYLEVD